MDKESIWQSLTELPPEGQRQVAEFIASLRERYGRVHQVKVVPPTDLSVEPFVGIWREREDLQDSSAWVKELRRRDWIGPGA